MTYPSFRSLLCTRTCTRYPSIIILLLPLLIIIIISASATAISYYYTRGAVPTPRQKAFFDSILTHSYNFSTCPSKCVLEYFETILRALHAASQQFSSYQPKDLPLWLDRHRINKFFAGSFKVLCDPNYIDQFPVYSHRQMIIGSAPGSTGTGTASAIMAVFGFQSLHWRSIALRNHSGMVHFNQYLPYLRSHGHPNYEYLAHINTLCTRRKENVGTFLDLFEHMDAIFDTPVSDLWFELSHAFPNFKFIFTDRNSTDWALKRKKHSLKNDVPFAGEKCRGLAVGLFRPDFIATNFDAFRTLQQCIIPPHRFHLINLKKEQQNINHNTFWSNLIHFLHIENTQNRAFINNNCSLFTHKSINSVGDQCMNALCQHAHRHCRYLPKPHPVAPFPESTYYL